MSEPLSEQLERLGTAPKSILRFSRSDVGSCRSGYPVAGYRWQSIKTDSDGVMQFLSLCWNNRETIIEALRAKEGE